MVRVAVLIPAGGAGRRMGGVFKPMLPLDGRPLLLHVLDRFTVRGDVVQVVVALPPDVLSSLPPELAAVQGVTFVAGGAERTDSVRNALAHVRGDVDVVLVHDAARPLVSDAVIERCITAAALGRSVIAAVAVTDTIQAVDDGGRIVATPERSTLRAAQTPQSFPARVLREAHARAATDGAHATDDAALVTRYGGDVYVVEGDVANLKVTSPHDLDVARVLLAARATGRNT